jgi:hypothetical protein
MTLPLTAGVDGQGLLLQPSAGRTVGGFRLSSGFIVNPVENISGSTTRSVVPANGARTLAKCARLAAASCQTSGCWAMLTRKLMTVLSLSECTR